MRNSEGRDWIFEDAAFLLSLKLPAYSGAFLLTIENFSVFLLTIGAFSLTILVFCCLQLSFFAYSGKVCLIRAF